MRISASKVVALARGVMIACLAASIAILSSPVRAEYPDSVINGIVPYSTGGTTDVLSRLYATFLSEELGQPVVIENKPGASGLIGVQHVVRAKPDGYTILFIANGATWNPALYKKLPYDPEKDLLPVAHLAEAPQMLVVNKEKFPEGDLKEFIAFAKANPGKLNIASTGAGLVENFILLENDLKMEIIPYKGSGDAMRAVVAGEVAIRSGSPDTIVPSVATGKTRILAVTSKKRQPSVPDVPTTAELGFPELNHQGLYGAFVPAGTPREIVMKLNAAMNAVSKNPQLQEKVAATGWTPLQSTPEEWNEFIMKDIARWKDVVKRAGIPQRE